MKLENLRPYIGFKIEISGEIFELNFEEDLSGEYAVWQSKNYLIYATPGWEGRNVPIDVKEILEDGDLIDPADNTDVYDKPVDTFKEYCAVVRALATKIIIIHKLKKEKKKTLQPEALKLYYGFKMEINGEMFELVDASDSGGNWAAWESEKYFIYATPGCIDNENIPVPIDVNEANGGDTIGSEQYMKPVKTFEEYCLVVKIIATKIIMLHELEMNTMSKPEVNLGDLHGPDGNVFVILGKCKKAAQKAGWSEKEWNAFQKEVISDDYAYMFLVINQYFIVLEEES